MGNCLLTKLNVVVNNPNIPVLEVMQQHTLDAIAASGNNSMTDEQKWALNHFFYQLGAFDSGVTIWSKLDLIVLPIIASVKDYTMVDYKTNANCIISSALQYFNLSERGIIGTTSAAILRKSIDSVDEKNVSMFVASSHVDKEYSGMIRFTNDGHINVGSQLSFSRNTYVNDTSNQNTLIVGPQNKIGYYFSSFPSTIIGVSLNGVDGTTIDNAYFYGKRQSDGLIVSAEANISPNFTDFTSTDNSEVSICCAPSANSNPLQVVIAGKGLTDAQTLKVVMAIDSLRSTFYQHQS